MLVERDRRAEDERLAKERAEQEELEKLGRIGRINLDPKTKSSLIDRLGFERYNQLPLYGEDQPRDSFGRYRLR